MSFFGDKLELDSYLTVLVFFGFCGGGFWAGEGKCYSLVFLSLILFSFNNQKLEGNNCKTQVKEIKSNSKVWVYSISMILLLTIKRFGMCQWVKGLATGNN